MQTQSSDANILLRRPRTLPSLYHCRYSEIENVEKVIAIIEEKSRWFVVTLHAVFRRFFECRCAV